MKTKTVSALATGKRGRVSTARRQSRDLHKRPPASATALLTRYQVASELSVHPITVSKLIASRQIESVHIGARNARVSRAALQRYIEARTRPADRRLS